MTFHIPKGLEIVATGKQVSLTPEGGDVKAVWESGVPIAVAGFNLGDFKTNSAKTPQGFGVDAYADTGPAGRVPAAAGERRTQATWPWETCRRLER